jgi:hypothetical protein
MGGWEFLDLETTSILVKNAGKEGNGEGEVVVKDIDVTYSVEQYIEMIDLHLSIILT